MGEDYESALERCLIETGESMCYYPGAVNPPERFAIHQYGVVARA